MAKTLSTFQKRGEKVKEFELKVEELEERIAPIYDFAGEKIFPVLH